MSRSKWKTPALNFFNTVNQKRNIIKKDLINRSSKIMPKFLGNTFKIHNGKSFIELLVSKNMIGHKFGEFVFTRTKYIFKNKKNKKKSKKANKKK
jgi:small subunit ribosomal protein S19